MLNNYHRQYSREYREAGFGRLADKRYRERNAQAIRERDRLRKQLKRKGQARPI